MKRAALLALVAIVALLGCRDISRFSTAGDHFEGSVVHADFVRAGVDASTTLCLTLDTDHLQDAPGTISTSDGRFAQAPLRPIPQIWHDPLSTLSFGEGREKNLVYVATPASDGDVMVVLSLMSNGNVEARFVRGAPNGAGAASSLFAVFQLERRAGKCSF